MHVSILRKLDNLSRGERFLIIVIIWFLLVFLDFFFVLFLNIPSGASLFFLMLAVATAIFCFRFWSGFIIGVSNSIINIIIGYASFKFNSHDFLTDEHYVYLFFSSLVYILFGTGLGYFNDLRRKQTANLKESEEKYRYLIDRLLVGVSIIQDDKIKYVNYRFGTILGLDAKKLIGKKITEISVVQDKNKIKKLISDRLGNKIPYIHDYFKARGKNNEILDLELIGAKINYGNKPAIGGAIVDITKRKRVEKEVENSNMKLQEIDKMRKNFVSITAHELRTPLNVISWTLEILKGEDAGKINIEQRSFLEDLYKTNQRMIVLVNDLLEVSRLDESRFKIEVGRYQLEDLIDEAIGQFVVKIRQKKLDFKWYRSKKSLPIIRTDDNRVMQILNNIIGNAVKYTPDGKNIEIKVKKTDKIAPDELVKKMNIRQRYNKYIICSVKDTGMGIPKEEQVKMFTRFFRAQNAVSSQIEGTGLGMFIVKKIVTLLGGMVWFESEEKRGTKVYFTLPIK